MDELIEQLLALHRGRDDRGWTTAGEVTATSPLRVDIDGVPVRVLRLTSYTPQVGHRALLVRVGVEWVAIGAVA